MTQTKRADKGNHRIDEDLKKFVLNTYQTGNKGSKRITRKQVYLRTKTKAVELGCKATDTADELNKRLIGRSPKMKFQCSKMI